jgi:membrane-bound lytic murein transglycosylase B
MQEQNLSKDEIQQVEQALDQKGFKSGQPDAVLGPETKNAIKEFQQKQG